MLFIFLVFNLSLSAQNQFDSPDEVVNQLYELATFKKGTTPDWNAVKNLFLEEAVIVLRTSRTKSTVFNFDGFVGDFVRFI